MHVLPGLLTAVSETRCVWQRWTHLQGWVCSAHGPLYGTSWSGGHVPGRVQEVVHQSGVSRDPHLCDRPDQQCSLCHVPHCTLPHTHVIRAAHLWQWQHHIPQRLPPAPGHLLLGTIHRSTSLRTLQQSSKEIAKLWCQWRKCCLSATLLRAMQQDFQFLSQYHYTWLCVTIWIRTSAKYQWLVQYCLSRHISKC